MQSPKNDEKGSPWLFFHLSSQWKLSFVVSLVIVAMSIGFFVWCTHVSDDRGGDSFVGLVFAFTSMIFLFLINETLRNILYISRYSVYLLRIRYKYDITLQKH
jgi:hypothetical protein